jgi:predicted transcriptional regulator
MEIGDWVGQLRAIHDITAMRCMVHHAIRCGAMWWMHRHTVISVSVNETLVLLAAGSELASRFASADIFFLTRLREPEIEVLVRLRGEIESSLLD